MRAQTSCLRRMTFASSSVMGAICGTPSGNSSLMEGKRGMKVRHKNFFRNEALSHARRVSWAPQTTPKKQGVFAKLSRSNFYDVVDTTFSEEPYSEEEIEAHRINSHDTYVYKYNVSPTHVSLRP